MSLVWPPSKIEKDLYGPKHHVAVLLTNHVSVFYMRPTTNSYSYIKCTYMIDRQYSHVVLSDDTSISSQRSPCIVKRETNGGGVSKIL